MKLPIVTSAIVALSLTVPSLASQAEGAGEATETTTATETTATETTATETAPTETAPTEEKKKHTKKKKEHHKKEAAGKHHAHHKAHKAPCPEGSGERVVEVPGQKIPFEGAVSPEKMESGTMGSEQPAGKMEKPGQFE